MLDKEGIKKYVMLYDQILRDHQIIVTDKDLQNIYQLILLTFDLDDLYDSIEYSPDALSVLATANPQIKVEHIFPRRIEKLPERIKIEKIKQAMISLMPAHNLIALNSIDLVFEAMEEEAHTDLSGSLHRYLSVCGKSIGAQLITGYLASKNQIELNIWLSDIIVKFNDDINDLIRLANDYLDTTVDVNRRSTEVPQLKAMKFFESKFEFKAYLSVRYVLHKIRYYLYSIYFKYLNSSPDQQDYSITINCIESVLDFAAKAYIDDKKSFRAPAI
jgi:hypothetical protein